MSRPAPPIWARLVAATAFVALSAALAPATAVQIAPGPAAAAEIQAAIDRVAKAGGGTVEIGPGRVPLRAAIRLADGVTLAGTPGQTVLAIEPGVQQQIAAPVAKGDTEIRVNDVAGLEPGDDVALEDEAGHGFQVTTATILERTGSNALRLSRPAESDYLPERGATVRRAHAGVGGWGVKRAAVEGVTVEGTLGQPGSQQLGGCRGGGIYLFGCDDVAVRHCTVRRSDGDGISFQRCRRVEVADCVVEENGNVGLHPGSNSRDCVVRDCVVRRNGYIGLFVCVGVRGTRFENNRILDNGGCGISIGCNDAENLFRGNEVAGNAETAVLFRRDSDRQEDGAHRNVFERNVFRDNLGPRPAKSNSRPDSAGRAAVVIEGFHQGIVFRGDTFAFSKPHDGPAILHDAASPPIVEQPRMENVRIVTATAHESAPAYPPKAVLKAGD